MKVYIVLKNGKVDQVFDNFEAALNHQANLVRSWNIADIIAREMKSV